MEKHPEEDQSLERKMQWAVQIKSPELLDKATQQVCDGRQLSFIDTRCGKRLEHKNAQISGRRSRTNKVEARQS